MVCGSDTGWREGAEGGWRAVASAPELSRWALLLLREALCGFPLASPEADRPCPRKLEVVSLSLFTASCSMGMS